MADLKPEQIAALLLPVIAIQIGLMLFALIDLSRNERSVRGGSKVVWAVIIVLINVIGPIVYFIAGRDEG